MLLRRVTLKGNIWFTQSINARSTAGIVYASLVSVKRNNPNKTTVHCVDSMRMQVQTLDFRAYQSGLHFVFSWTCRFKLYLNRCNVHSTKKSLSSTSFGLNKFLLEISFVAFFPTVALVLNTSTLHTF